MKRALWIITAVAWGIAGSRTANAIEPRKDINPALLYWQAFSRFPDLDGTDESLLSGESRGKVTEEERELARRFDASAALIQRARTMAEPCDWGSDVADGPEAYVPNIKSLRTAASAALLRARVALADGQELAVSDELLGLSVLGRNSAVGGSLVITMVQLSIEARVLDFISAHFEQLKPGIRRQIADGLNGLPRRRTVAEAMVTEREGFQRWLSDRLEQFRTKNSDEKALEQFRALMETTFTTEPALADSIIEAGGGTTAGVIRYIKDTEPIYAQSVAIARAPASDLKRRTADFESAINTTTNLLARAVIPNIVKARARELEILGRLARLPASPP